MNYKKMITDENGNYDQKKDILARQSIYGDEYYTLPIHAKQIVECLNIPGGSIIWCPFDKEESEFVKALQEKTIEWCMGI